MVRNCTQAPGESGVRNGKRGLYQAAVLSGARLAMQLCRAVQLAGGGGLVANAGDVFEVDKNQFFRDLIVSEYLSD